MDTIDKLRISNQQNVTILEGQMSFQDKHALNVDQNTTAVHVIQNLLASTLVLNPSLPRDPDIHQWFQLKSCPAYTKATQPNYYHVILTKQIQTMPNFL